MTTVPQQYATHPKAEPGTPCSICGDVPLRPFVEHCHTHGWVRGVACGRCNAAMALIDKGIEPNRVTKVVPLAVLVEHAHRCHECPRIDLGRLRPSGSLRSLRTGPDKPEIVPYNTRYPEDLHQQLKAAADEDERSYNGEVVWLLRQALAARQSKPDTEETQP